MLRRNRNTNRFEDGSRSSIGDNYVVSACENLNRACLKEAAMFLPTFTVEDLTPMLFQDEDVAILRLADGRVINHADQCCLDLAPWAPAIIALDYGKAAMCTPNQEIYKPYPERLQPLREAVHALDALHMKWGMVEHVLKWFNRNATPGAIRANWPSVMALCGDAPSMKDLQHAPVRYTNPHDLALMLPLIRATATTVAAMAMIPNEALPRPRGTVRLTLPARTATYEGVAVDLEMQSFFL